LNFSVIAVIFLIFSLVNSIFSSEKKNKHRPTTGRYNQMPPVFKKVSNKVQSDLKLEKETEEGTLEYSVKLDNLNHMKINSSEEKIQTESATQDIFTEYEYIDENEYSMEDEFDFTDIQKSIILAEILGPPRVLKRNIR